MVLRDSVSIEASPEKIFQFFQEMERNYLRWHHDHVLFRWVSGRGLSEGHVFYFEEYIAGKLLKKNVVFTRVVPNQHVEFAPTFWLMKLFLPRMLFRIESDPVGSRLIAEIHLRIGPLAQRFQRKELDAVRDLMREEALNLQRIVTEGRWT
jgi:hypothetical protein